MELSKQQAQSILDGEKRFAGRIMKGDVLAWYYEAERLLRGWETTKPRGCSCEYRALANEVHSLIGQHKSYIESIVNGEVTTQPS